MHDLEVPPAVLTALGGGRRPLVVITINGHSWRSRIATMRGRHLIGLSNANRATAGVATGDVIDVDVHIDDAPRPAIEPADVTEALNRRPGARAAFDARTESQRRQHLRVIDAAKRPETRQRRIEALLDELLGDAG